MVSHDNLTKILKRFFNYDHFRPGQLVVLDSLIHGNNTLAVLPTGSGKTLLYQIYGLLIQKPVLIISPLLALMTDQIARMQAIGIKKVAAVNSTMSSLDQQRVLNNLAHYQFIYVSPEMLAKPSVIKQMQQVTWGLMVIDEAHCISQWGHDFRPDYLMLKTVIEQLGNPLLLMLTATASQYTKQDILKSLGLADCSVNVIQHSVNRPNIFLAVRQVNTDHDKVEQIKHLVTHLKGAGLIYFSSRKLANQLSQTLSDECGIRAAAFHSGLNPDAKYKIQHQFMNGELDVICATSAFGMGINKNDVRYVIHYHMPIDLESYVQEIGRAGRDGKQSVAILLYRPSDETLPLMLATQNLATADEINFVARHPQQAKQLIEQGDLKTNLIIAYLKQGLDEKQIITQFQHLRNRKQGNLRAMLEYIQTDQCRRQLLLNYFNESGIEHTKTCCNGLLTPLSLQKLGLFIEKHHHVQLSMQWQPLIEQLFNPNMEK